MAFDPHALYRDSVGYWVVTVAAMMLLLFVVVTAVAYVVYAERVLLGRMQARPGPNRVGPRGLMQPAADGVKLAFKESFLPADVDRFLYLLAPMVAMFAALLSWAVIPVGVWFGVYYWVANVNIGILLVFGIGAMNVYAIMLGGWASNNKYSLLGGLRSAAQLISYEMAMGLSVVPTFMIVGSLRLQDIASYSVHWGPYTGPLPLVLLTPLGFVIYLVSAVAETNRAPFDLPEAEQELVGGFLTEYTGIRFLMFMIGEYANVITQSTLVVILFFGAWWPTFPWLPAAVVFLAKVVFFIFVFIWLRGTLPRLRYDMLMRLGWKVMLPLALLNVVVTAVLVVLFQG